MNRDVRQRVRHIGAIIGILAFVAVADADTVKGELSFNSKGTWKVTECKSGRIINLGTMTLNQSLRLDQQYSRLSFYGKTPVLIEVRGAVTREGPPGTELTLQSPNVVRVISGRCSENA